MIGFMSKYFLFSISVTPENAPKAFYIKILINHCEKENGSVSDVTKLVKILIRGVRILAFKIRRMRIREFIKTSYYISTV